MERNRRRGMPAPGTNARIEHHPAQTGPGRERHHQHRSTRPPQRTGAKPGPAGDHRTLPQHDRSQVRHRVHLQALVLAPGRTIAGTRTTTTGAIRTGQTGLHECQGHARGTARLPPAHSGRNFGGGAGLGRSPLQRRHGTSGKRGPTRGGCHGRDRDNGSGRGVVVQTGRGAIPNPRRRRRRGEHQRAATSGCRDDGSVCRNARTQITRGSHRGVSVGAPGVPGGTSTGAGTFTFTCTCTFTCSTIWRRSPTDSSPRFRSRVFDPSGFSGWILEIGCHHRHGGTTGHRLGIHVLSRIRPQPGVAFHGIRQSPPRFDL
mmetsp:Transcript_17302/g.35857  ORF Transcript_17302/g.35857 Transcript_17302/m.35857 type:complete len:317 (-) Transcript_17302:1677-2627(-)